MRHTDLAQVRVKPGKQPLRRQTLRQSVMIKFLQINLHRSAIAQNHLKQTAAERGTQVLLVSEQNWNPTNSDWWVSSTDGSCAITTTRSSNLLIRSHGSVYGFAWLQTDTLRVYSSYNTRNCTLDSFRSFLANL